jgi:hypothetical protein
MKNRFILWLPLFFFLTFSLIPKVAAEEQSISEFISQIQESLERKDIPAYLESFSDEIRAKEGLIVQDKFKTLRMDSISLFKPSKLTQTEDEAKIYLQAMFQNSYSAAIETWHLSLIKVNGQWVIEQKNVLGRVNIMYKIKIPSERAERVKSIEIEHADISKLNMRILNFPLKMRQFFMITFQVLKLAFLSWVKVIYTFLPLIQEKSISLI